MLILVPVVLFYAFVARNPVVFILLLSTSAKDPDIVIIILQRKFEGMIPQLALKLAVDCLASMKSL
uniref:Uncharacterized protein n=1 Tax=Solanum lycopersicum TaxID=4081 RepID=A0A3Q7GWK8_SOLLC